MLIALLPVGYLAPVVVWQYGLWVLALSLSLALLADLVGKSLDVSPMGLIFAALAAVICVDAAFGSPLVATDLLSGFYLAGIRFYGLGNEYTGFLLGAALTAWGLLSPLPPFLASGKGTHEGEEDGRGVRVLLAIAITLLIGLPWCGADAGGALAATVAFMLAIGQRREGALRPRLRSVFAAFAAAFVVVLLLALVDRAQGAGARTHIGGRLRKDRHAVSGLSGILSSAK